MAMIFLISSNHWTECEGKVPGGAKLLSTLFLNSGLSTLEKYPYSYLTTFKSSKIKKMSYPVHKAPTLRRVWER
ncbi:hypothetical protein C1H46_010737 [Malus baccata]|uniref:Uncharacterized protein n=1 Tax=Malus baccata TaxID=106549 RepID=A0A540MXT8_MALBA|nr:hypothetical protein C1H46_010737 [Malus baccata]